MRVGIIGANARGGWASESHVPATQSLDGLSLEAVATNSMETAEEAAHAFGVSKAYGDGQELIADREIDIVTVAPECPITAILCSPRLRPASTSTANGLSAEVARKAAK